MIADSFVQMDPDQNVVNNISLGYSLSPNINLDHSDE